MALSSPHIQRFLLCKLHNRSTAKNIHRNNFTTSSRSRCCSAIAIDAPSSLTEVPGIRWGSIALQGLREEMEDDIIVRPEGLQGFSFAAVFDGHGGFSSVEFLRDELYKECVNALQGGLLLVEKDFKAIKGALQEAFLKVDTRLLKRLEMNGEEDESGATATTVFIGDDELLISHIGDSTVVLCRSGKAEVLTSPHRPPLLMNGNYTASTIPWRLPSDDPSIPTPIELSWLNLFLNTIPTFKKHAESDTSVPDAVNKAEEFAQRFARIIEDFKKDPASQGVPLDVLLPCRLREQVLKELGFRDIFKKIKDVENANAISLFENVVRLNDAIEDEGKRLENLVRGIFAGNIFDLGASQLAEVFSRDGMSFSVTCQNLVPRPWVIDDLETFKMKWSKKSWKKVIIFVDNSGADIILGILPFARELLRHGSQVILAANDLPSLNAGFPHLLPDEDDAGNLVEDANFPENHFDGHEHDVGGFPGDTDSPQKEEHVEEGHGAGDVPEDFDSLLKQESEIDSKGNEIKKWPGWPGENVFRMLVPVQKVGSIIGRKGEFIKKITEETKARIKILDGPPGISERAVMVSAKEEPDRPIPPAIDGLLRVHKQVINVDRDLVDSALAAGRSVVTRLLVADTQAGSLIGKQGSTIKSIQDGSGCTIRVLGSENLPVFALRDDSIVEIQGESAGVHKAVELIAVHLRKFLVDRSIVGVFETQMQRPDVRVNQNVPPHQNWGPPPQGFPAPAGGGGGGPAFAPNHQYMPPSHHYDSYYPPTELPPMDKHLHQGPPPAYAKDASMGIHSSSAPPQQSVVTKVTQHMQIPLTYADAVIGASGTNISYIRRASGASITIQETRGVPGEMTVEISGTSSQIQAAQQLVQNFMAEAASATQDPMGGSVSQGYSAYPTTAPVYAPPTSAGGGGHTGHAPSADYGPLYGTNYGY